MLLILLNAALMTLVGSYQAKALTGAQEKWSDLRRQAASAGKADAAARYRQTAADLEKLKARIPARREFARVLSDLFESAASSGVTTGAVSYKPQKVKGEELLSYQLSFAVHGSYAAVKSYLADLQNYPELIVIDNLSLSNADMFVENVTLDLNLSVYLREGA